MLIAAKRASILSRVVYGYAINLTKTLYTKLITTDKLIEWDAVVVVVYALSVVEILR